MMTNSVLNYAMHFVRSGNCKEDTKILKEELQMCKNENEYVLKLIFNTTNKLFEVEDKDEGLKA